MAQREAARSRFPRGGLGRRLALLTFLSAAGVAVSLAAVALVAAHALARQNIDALHPIVQEWSGERVASWLHEVRGEIEDVAGDEALERALAAEVASDVGHVLAARAANTRSLAGLIALDPSGAPLAWAGPSEVLPALLDAIAETNALESELATVMRRAELLRALTAPSETTVQTLDLGATTLAFIVSTPLRDADGAPLGSLHGVLDREALAAQLCVDLLGAGGVVSIVHRESGVIGVAGAAEPKWMHSLAIAALEEDGSAPAHLLRRDAARWVVVSARPIEGSDWTVVVVQGARAAFAPVLLVTLGVVICAPLLVLIIASLGSALMVRLLRPVGALYAALRDVEKGDLDTELRVDSARGELAAVFRAYNAMTAQLRAARDKQHENTRALSEQNQVCCSSSTSTTSRS
jgi:HAMP domain-containing protein